MIEYLPWSHKTLNECTSAHSNKKIPTLDLEFSSVCTGANCVYCDSKPFVGSKMKNELTKDSMMILLKKCKEKGLKWIYTCGLGEPTEDAKFWDALSFAKESNIVISLFSNGLFITKEKAKRLKDSGACIILKMDTFDKKNFDLILGGTGRAEKVYQSLDYLLDAGYGSNTQYTDLAFSIVPTSLSLSGIPDVIQFALENGIFPSVGELEKAGNANKNNTYDSLHVGVDQLQEIKKLLDKHFDGNYKRPICPAIITGLHFNNMGNCIIDKETGLNCIWFMLKEPKISIIGNYKDDLDELYDTIDKIRRNFFSHYLDGSSYKDVFGGCGGNRQEIFQKARTCMFEGK